MFDLRKNMLTLPIIYITSKQSDSDKKGFISNLKYLSKKNRKEDIKELIINLGGIDYANNKIAQLSSDAIKDLSYFPDTDIKSALVSAIDFNNKRKY